jgi:hypothetical protein
MKRIRVHSIIYNILIWTFGIAILASCSGKPSDDKIILTLTEKGNKEISGESIHSKELVSRIICISIRKTSASPEVLSQGFYSACSPQVSYDGTHILFSGKKNEKDPWSIWEMKADGSHPRQITSVSENCTNPVYLPSGRVAFCKSPLNYSPKTGQPVFVCNIDGSEMKQITYSPEEFIISSVLNDGRILITKRQLYPSEGDPVMMVLRPDGTKAEIFYRNESGKVLPGSARETDDGRIIFIESDTTSVKSNLVSITYNRPLHSRKVLSSGIEGDFGSVVQLKEGKMLVSYRKSGSSDFGLYEFDPATRSPGTPIYETPGFDISDIALARVYARPKKLPSEVDMGVKTGLLFIQDIKINGNRKVNSDLTLPAASRIAIMGIDSTLGIVDADADGSFYLKIIADTPVKIGTLDEKGSVIDSPCDWIWLRPNERRGCIGCHDDPEMVPGNRRPLAVMKNPVNIPVHVNKMTEKKISLE